MSIKLDSRFSDDDFARSNSTETDDDDSLYSDIATVEYDYDEELYEDVEEEEAPRQFPNDPIGKFWIFMDGPVFYTGTWTHNEHSTLNIGIQL